jgi:sugar lactone lactonase YvrE
MRLTICFALSLLAACGPAESPTPPPAPTPAPAPTPTPTTAPSPAPSAAPAPDPTPTPAPAVKWPSGFATPECVIYEPVGDHYLVSNINGTIFAADNNGYISDLNPAGVVTKDKWIEGGQNGVTLNAPKGMAIARGVLYVADLDTVRMFDAKTGAPKGDIKLEGATFANDVAAAADGKIYVSDSGIGPDGNDFKPTGTDTVWVISGGKAKALAKSADLSRPNGLYVDGGTVWVVTFGADELFSLDAKGGKRGITKIPAGGLDGLMKVGDKFIVTSWQGTTIYRGKAGAAFEPFVTNITAPADIGYDTKRKRILVPRFMANTVEAYDLP